MKILILSSTSGTEEQVELTPGTQGMSVYRLWSVGRTVRTNSWLHSSAFGPEKRSVFHLFPWTLGHVGLMTSCWVSVPDVPCPHLKTAQGPPKPWALSSVLCGRMPSGAAGCRAPCRVTGRLCTGICSLQVFTRAWQRLVPHKTPCIVASLPYESQQKSTSNLIFVSAVV